jgi:hypothetical protein
MDRQQEYLRLLQEKNRLKKMMTAKSEEEIMKEELERGFSTHFRGAHAPKEKAAPSKLEGKPSVKVHKSPDNDLIKRLAPPSVSDQPRNSSRQEGRRTRFERSDEDEYNYEEQQYIEPISATTSENISRKSERESVSRKSDAPNVNDLLLGQITSMDENQKLALLQLLQQSMAPKQDSVGENYDDRKDDDADREYEENLEKEIANDLRDAEEETMKQIEKLELEDKFPSKSRSQGLETSRAEESLLSCNINLKIRLSSAWGTAKNFSLQGIRLRSFLASSMQSSNSTTEYVDLLQFLKYKVLLGMVPANKTSESFTLMNNLMGVGIGFKANTWKAPCSSFQSIELVFEGAVPPHLLANFSDEQEFLKSIELLIWNGISDESLADSSSINASPVKDMDVFVNEICVWSGEVNAESRKSEITRAADVLASLSKNESKPSVVIKPWVARPKTGQANFQKKVDISIPSESASSLSKKLFNSPPRKTSTPFKKHSESDVMEDSLSNQNDVNRPDWLQFAKEPMQKSTIVLTPSSKGKPLEAFPKSPERTNHHEDGLKFGSPSKSASKASNKAVARRRRGRENGSFDAEAGITLSPNRKKTPKTLNEVKDLDVNLRKSIEAVEYSEKFNLNRLETITKKPLSAKRVSNDPSVHDLQKQNLLKSESKKVLIDEEPEIIVDPAQDSTDFLPDVEAQNIPKVTSDDGNNTNNDDRAEMLENRAAKIEQVNAKLNTVLTDLADILAGLPKQPVTEDERRVPLKNSPAKKTETTKENPALPVASPFPVSKKIVAANLADLPTGKQLTIEILTTHGDTSYVGLNGLEFFDREGNNIVEGHPEIVSSISANPMDLGALPGYSDDPRKINNLIDGVNHTKDDLHQWLAPHLRVVRDYSAAPSSNPNDDAEIKMVATITVNFSSIQSLSMIKIYNFNKSRTHNQRGARDIRILFDGKEIYSGLVSDQIL